MSHVVSDPAEDFSEPSSDKTAGSKADQTRAVAPSEPFAPAVPATRNDDTDHSSTRSDVPASARPALRRWGDLLGGLTFVSLVVTGIWSAWDDGAGLRSTRCIALIIVTLLLPLGLLAARLRDGTVCRPPILVWLALIVWLLGLLQTVPLPKSWVRSISPASHQAYETFLPAAVREELLGVEPVAAATTCAEAIPVSISPTYTRMALSIPLLFAATCWLSSLLASDGKWLVTGLILVAIAGSFFSVLGLADSVRLQRDREVELRQRLIISPVGADDPFGPFVNNNNGAGYINLAIGCAVGCLFIAIANFRRHRGNRDLAFGIGGWQIVASLLLIAVMVAGVLGSSSRGAFVGLVTGTLVLLMVASRGWMRVALVLLLVVTGSGAVAVLGWLGINEHTENRLQTLYDGWALQDPRLHHWQDGLTASAQSIFTGAGFGTYRYAYLPFQQYGGGSWFINADGMPVEWLVEGGLWLPAIAIAAILLLIRQAGRLRGQQHEADRHSFARVAAAGVLAAVSFVLPMLLVSQLFDFGILLFPLLISFAIICGAVPAARRNLRRLDRPSGDPLSGNGRRTVTRSLPSIVAFMLLMIGMPIAAFDLHSGSIAENAKRSLGGRYSGPVDNDQQQADRIAKLRRWIALRPTDATLRQALASLLIDQQRRIGMRYLVEKGITDRNNARRWTAARNVRKAYDESRRQDTSDGKPKSPDSVTLDHVLLPGQDEAVWREARRHALTATGLNPLDDAARVTLVELDFLHPDSRQTSNRLLRDTARLRNRSADALYYLRSLSEPGPDDETRSFIDQLIAELKRP